MQIFDFRNQESLVFAKLKVELRKSGKTIEDFDLMIASICLANDLSLVTANTKHFTDIVGLKLEDWSLD